MIKINQELLEFLDLENRVDRRFISYGGKLKETKIFPMTYYEAKLVNKCASSFISDDDKFEINGHKYTKEAYIMTRNLNYELVEVDYNPGNISGKKELHLTVWYERYEKGDIK